jgi:hypothetical protein
LSAWFTSYVVPQTTMHDHMKFLESHFDCAKHFWVPCGTF